MENNNVIIYYPNKFYLDDNFPKIKRELKLQKSNFKDFGSIVYFKNKKFSMTLNNMYELDVYLNTDNIFLDKEVKSIKNIIENVIKGFYFIKRFNENIS